MATGTVNTGPIHLSFRSVQKVVVEPADANRFVVAAKEATRACAVAQNEKELLESFNRVLLFIHEWCIKHSGDIRAVYAYPADGALTILICTRGPDYRFDFDDQATELDLEVARQFPWLIADVMQVPEGSREGCIVLEKAIVVYGDSSISREPSNS